MRNKNNGRNKGGGKKLVNIISKLAQKQANKDSEDEVVENDEKVSVNDVAADDDSVIEVKSSPPESNRRSKRKPEKTAKSTPDQPTVEVPNGNVTIVEAVLSDDDFEAPLQQEEVCNHIEENVKKKKTRKQRSENNLVEMTDPVLKVVDCTACSRSISTKGGKFCRHPDLNTIMCKQCYKFYSSGKFTKDEYGVEEFCRWCADGGELICCDFCEKAFCKKCIKRNLGKTKLQELLDADENEKWSCFCCDPAPISSAIKMCNRVMHMLDEKKDQHTPYKDKKGRGIIHGPNRGERRNLLTSFSSKQTVKSETSTTKKTYSNDFENGVSSTSDVSDKNEQSCDDSEDAPVVVKKETIVTTVDSSEEDASNSDEHSESDKSSNSKTKYKGAAKNEKNNDEETNSSGGDVPQRKRANKKKKSDDTNRISKKKHLAKKERENSKSARKKIESDSADDFVQTKNKKKGKNRKVASSDEESDKQSSDEQSESSEQDSGEISIKRKKNRRQMTRGSDSQTDSDVKAKKQRKKKSINKTRKTGKWRLRRQQGGSDESDSDDSSGTENKKKSKAKKKVDKKKKRKVKRKRSEDDEDESDDEDASPSKKGRKKIRKILDNEKLAEATRHARQLEEERRQRLLEKTKNTVFDKPETVDLKEVVLEYKADKKTPVIEVDEDLVKHLKPHQVEGVKFMYDCTIESAKRWSNKEEGGGCILAHVMGLGKTLQVVTLVHTLYHSEIIKLRRVLVVCPLNTVLNWQAEFEKWLSVDERLNVYVLNEMKSNWHRADMLNDWMNYGGVLILGYTMYRNLSQCLHVRNKRQKKIFKECLVDPGPELVVCDEGHILRNCKSGISIAMNEIKTRRRIVLTGTPLQNNLVEYHCMVSFVKPNLLGSLKEFSNSFIRPIENGQCADSTVLDVILMKKRCHVLHKMLAGCVQRKDYAEIAKFLPPKFEYVIKIRLTEKQHDMYKYYLDTFLTFDDENKVKGTSLFSDYQALMRIWTHPWSLKLVTAKRIENNFADTDDEGSLKDFIDDAEESSVTSEDMSWSSDSANDNENDLGKQGKKRSENTSEEESEEDNSDENDSEENDSKKNDSEKKIEKTRNEQKSDSDKKETSKNIKADPDGPSTSTAAAADDDDEIVEVKPFVNGKPAGKEPEDGVTKVARSLRSGQEFKEPTPPVEEEEEWYDKFLTEEDEKNVELGSKIMLLLEILADAAALEEKVILFSHSLISLDVIEMALGGGEIGGNSEDWCRGCDYFRMDGSTSAQMRKRWADIFNDEENKAARLFLISTKAGGLGINLVGASRVVVFDISWNPSHDVQSIFRAYRFGQNKPVFVYRFIAQGTMEEKIYDRQVTKLSMSQRVVDEHQIQRHFNANDLAELYRFEPDVLGNEERPTPTVPKDAILAELINRLYPKWIVKYLEHDSLLQNRPEEELTEAERKEAWDHWELEKEGALQAPQIRAQNIQQMVNGVNLQMPNPIFIGSAGPNPILRPTFPVGGPRPSVPPQTAATFAGVQRPPNYQQIILEEQRRRLFEMERRRIQEAEHRAREGIVRMQQEQQRRQQTEERVREARLLAEQQRQRAEQQQQRQRAEQQRRQQEARQRAEQQQRLREQQQRAAQQRLQREQQQRQEQRQEQQQQQMGQQYLQQLLQNRNAYVTQQPGNGNQQVIRIVLDNNNSNNNPSQPPTSRRSPPRIIELPPDA